MTCKLCQDGYFPVVNVNGVIWHRTTDVSTGRDIRCLGYPDSADDGPEIIMIRFFQMFPEGSPFKIPK